LHAAKAGFGQTLRRPPPVVAGFPRFFTWHVICLCRSYAVDDTAKRSEQKTTKPNPIEICESLRIERR